MSSKKKYEYREKKNFNRDSEGLKQRRLKEESRWRFNPNESYDEEEDGGEDFDDYDYEENYR